jgi:hypothetical protein
LVIFKAYSGGLFAHNRYANTYILFFIFFAKKFYKTNITY